MCIRDRGNVGTLAAHKEKEIQGILQDLWHTLADIFLDREKSVTNKKKDEKIEENL